MLAGETGQRRPARTQPRQRPGPQRSTSRRRAPSAEMSVAIILRARPLQRERDRDAPAARADVDDQRTRNRIARAQLSSASSMIPSVSGLGISTDRRHAKRPSVELARARDVRDGFVTGPARRRVARDVRRGLAARRRAAGWPTARSSSRARIAPGRLRPAAPRRARIRRPSGVLPRDRQHS